MTIAFRPAQLVRREREMEALEAVLASADPDPHPFLNVGRTADQQVPRPERA